MSQAITAYAEAYAPIASDLTAIADHGWALTLDGQSRPSATGATYTTFDPVSGRALAEVPDAGGGDVDLAVQSALAAFASWRRRSPLDRADAVRELAGALRTHADELALLDALDGGSPITMMRGDVAIAADFLDRFADWALALSGRTVPASVGGLHYTKLEPYGVVGRIIPFNHPAMFAAAKLGAPLVAGNTVVVKAPPQTPLSALRIGELCAEVLPPGVVNVLTGSTSVPGEALARHPDVRRVAFIGSERAGRSVQHSGADGGVKHITLELGGKNATVVRPDADLERAAAGAVRGMNFAGQGQSCGSNSRLLVHASIVDEMIDRVSALCADIQVGVAVDPATEMGSLVSAEHHERVLSHVQTGIDDGADLVVGGRRPDHLPYGCFLEPTVFARVDRNMRIAQEEIFGPVMSVLSFGDDEEALSIANGVRYGLTASVWTRDLDRALWFVDGFEAGCIAVNDWARHHPGMPFGGHKASGVGSEEGIEELLEMTQIKSVSISLGDGR